MIPTGSDLRAARKAKGLNQTELGKLAGCGRHTVSYWECKSTLSRYGACAAMCRTLGVYVPDRLERFRLSDAQQEAVDRRWQAELQRLREAEERQNATRRVVCGAKTRKGRPCRAMSEPGRVRCRFHGGKSHRAENRGRTPADSRSAKTALGGVSRWRDLVTLQLMLFRNRSFYLGFELRRIPNELR